jgi:hypothetical protein
VATISHASYGEAIQSITLTGFDGRATGNYSNALTSTSAITNDSDLYLFADFELHLNTMGSNASAGGYVALYILASVDGGTTYPDGSSAVPPAESNLAAVFPATSGTVAKTMTATNVPLPPAKFLVMLGNFTGGSAASPYGTLRYRRHNLNVQ